MPDTWYKVDNVAKVFLATATRRDPRVFRVSCTLNEDIDPPTLDAALVRVAHEMPQFQVTLHRGLFWHYLESTDQLPHAEPEAQAPCAALYGPELRNRLLYRVSYFGPRINVEMFHVIADGNGGLLFLKALVHTYLALLHPALAEVPRQDGSSSADREQDSYQNFYTGSRSHRRRLDKKQRAYHIRGLRLPNHQLQYFEAHLSARQLLDRARALHVTLTSYLGASLMMAIYAEMPALQRSEPVTISLPVNLRNYFPSATARNFFNSVYISHAFSGEETLAELAAQFDAQLRETLSPENIKARMDEYEKLEMMPAIRPVPLVIKNPTVGFFSGLEKGRVTAVLSNLGRVQIPGELQPYVRSFSGFSSCESMFTCVISYGDDLVLGTASSYRSTNILRRFYRTFAEAGLSVILYATEVEK